MEVEKFRGGFSIGLILLASLILLALAVPVSSVALAQGEAEAKTEAAIIGFSADGKYVAYEVYGESAISPDAHSIIRFVNVAKNKFVGKRIIYADSYEDGTTLKKIRAKARKKAGIYFRRLGITPGEFPGDEVEITSRSPKNQKGFRIDFKANKNFYRLELFKRVVRRKGYCQKILENKTLKIFTLRLKEMQTGAFKILQKDRKLYKSRGCVFKYDFHSAFFHRDKLVVFINAKSMDQEGSMLTQLVVTGKLKFR